MSEHVTVYDLGEITERDGTAGAKSASTRVLSTVGGRRRGTAGPELACSFSLFLPGVGQMLAGEFARGLSFLSGIGFCAAAFWAIGSSLTALTRTLALFGVPAEVPVGCLGGLFGATALLHLSAVLDAHALGAQSRAPLAPHPVVAGLASALVPGWGQVLTAHRARAVLFLGSLWAMAGLALACHPTTQQLMGSLGVRWPFGLPDPWQLVALAVPPLMVWILAVYDAASGALADWRRSS
ncbi:MAG TPA: hypothetical protein VJS92_10220 [Candidatus Polarisedimenticolaceae bacterium]|nr:hypothetical protein [Candidatus Polarisedimenticolaceae bacterium]